MGEEASLAHRTRGLLCYNCSGMKPKLQVALDFTELDRALKVAEEVAAAGEVILEAGTPLIKSCGLEAVRAMRKRFPSAVIVADMKVMDTGRIEAEMAFKAGASVVTVMGNASDGTIREAVRAAGNYGGKVLVDLMEEAATAHRAQEAEKLGCHIIGIHIPIDEQMSGEISFSLLKEVAAAVTVPVAVAGGIHSANAARAVEAGASILIVGGAITKSADARAATRDILSAMETGKIVPTRFYRRVSLDGVKDAFAQVSTANVSDALHRRGWLAGVLPVVRGAKAAGPAVTVRTYPGDWAKPVEAVDLAEPGSVIVIDAGGVPPAVWGELATHSAVARKLAGVVIYGGIRDSADIRALNFPAYASLVCSAAGEPKGFGEINVPVRFGGQEISPGDWIVCDDDGVVAVPKEQVVETANRAMDVLERENRLRKEIDSGGTLARIAELLKWEKPR